MGNETFSAYDPADYLTSFEDVVAYLEAVIEEGEDDPVVITQALGAIARSRSLSEIARQAGMSREGLTRPCLPTAVPASALWSRSPRRSAFASTSNPSPEVQDFNRSPSQPQERTFDRSVIRAREGAEAKCRRPTSRCRSAAVGLPRRVHELSPATGCAATPGGPRRRVRPPERDVARWTGEICAGLLPRTTSRVDLQDRADAVLGRTGRPEPGRSLPVRVPTPVPQGCGGYLARAVSRAPIDPLRTSRRPVRRRRPGAAGPGTR